MKKILLEFCFWVNLLVYLLLIILFIEMIGNTELVSQFFTEGRLSEYRMLLNIPILILWIYNIVVWSKNDKKTLRLILIIFLNGFYNPFYYRMAVKKKWLV
jgi:hypothetical protein